MFLQDYKNMTGDDYTVFSPDEQQEGQQ